MGLFSSPYFGLSTPLPASSLYAIPLAVTLPPVVPQPIRFPAGQTPQVIWTFQNASGASVSLTGKAITLTIYLDLGAVQQTVLTKTTEDELEVSGSTVTWEPISSDLPSGIYRYVLTDSTDDQLLASGSLSLWPT